VHVQHHLGSAFAVEAEEPFEHVHHELHRRVVVVQQHHLVQRWLLYLGPGFAHIKRAVVALSFPITHDNSLPPLAARADRHDAGRQGLRPMLRLRLPLVNTAFDGVCQGKFGVDFRL
jgi:hypothetical protein